MCFSDFLWFVYIRASDNVVTPWFKQYLREQFSRVAVFGEDIVAVSLPEPKPKIPYFASIPPSASHFYKDYGPDYKERYQWLVPPTTAAYTVKNDDIVKICKLADFNVSKSELGAIFRNENHPKYVECGDQFLRNFLNGLVIHMRGPMPEKKTGKPALKKE